MKIMIIGNFGISWDGSICDEKHIADALKNLGHEVIEMQREDVSEGLHMTYKAFDFILIAQWNSYPEHICKTLREEHDCPIIYWAFDYQFESHEDWHFEMAKEADLFLSPELEHKQEYLDMGVNFYWFPQSFAPDFLERIRGNHFKEYDVVFTGSLNPNNKRRYDLLKAVDEKFDLHIFTTTPDDSFKNVHPAVLDYDLPYLIAKTKINLSIDSFHIEGSWSDRNAQILACGGFVLFKYIPQSENFFHDWVEYFHTTEECLEKIDYFLKNPKKTKVIDSLKVTPRVKGLLEVIKEKLCI